MTSRIGFAVPLLLLVVCACSSAPSRPILATFDACTLLTAADIAEVQGEKPVESTPSEQADGTAIMHQCFFRLGEFSKSISISAATVGRAHWDRMFAERKGSEEEEKREREGRGNTARRKVRGLGNEAYWLPTPVGGTLYVRQGENLLRIGIGGSANDADRLAKAVALARRALPRLPAM